MAEMGGSRSRAWREAPEDDAVQAGPATEPGLDVVVLEPGRVRTRPVPITKAEFREYVERLARIRQFQGSPQEVAAEVLKVQELVHQAREARTVSDEILSGTEPNFETHGRRMASTFFRMIFF